MAKFIKLDEEFKQNLTDKYNKVKDKVSDAILTEDGSLDTERIGSAVKNTADKLEAGVKDRYQKFNEAYRKEDGKLDTDKLGDAAESAYRRAGRSLATGMTRLAGKLSDHFGTNETSGTVIDAEPVDHEAPQSTAGEANYEAWKTPTEETDFADWANPAEPEL